MEQEALVIHLLVSHLDRDRFTAIRARRLDPTIRVQGSTDAERIPDAIAVPPAIGRVHPIGRRHSRERVSHTNLGFGGVEHQRVCRMKLAPKVLDFADGQINLECYLFRRRSAA
jgi:hypothetical protein